MEIYRLYIIHLCFPAVSPFLSDQTYDFLVIETCLIDVALSIITTIYSETCVIRTPWDQIKCPDHQGVLIFQVSLHAKGYFGM